MDSPDNTPLPDIDEQNDAQRDSGSQANDVANDARLRSTDLSEGSDHGGTPNPAQIIRDDVPDLVDKMEEMNRSGRIDYDAFAGEPTMDDEEDYLGNADSDDDE